MTHPAIDAFGDLDEAAADPHVSTCEQCRAELDAQLQVRALLTGLPDPGPVPPDVLHHIESTLRSLAGAPVDGRDESTAGRTVVPLQEAPSVRRRRRPLLTVAAALVVVAGGGAALSQVLTGSSGRDTAGASASLDSGAGRHALSEKGAELGVRSIASGTDYTKAHLAAQVQKVMSTAGSAAPSGRSSTQSPAGSGSLTAADGAMTAPAGVRACLSALGAPSATPLLVDVARFEGRPAAVVVLPTEQGGREVWVVSTSCKPGADGTRYYTVLR